MAKAKQQAVRQQPPEPRSQSLWGLMAVLGVVLTALLLGGAGWGVQWLRDPATLPIRTVLIEGELRHLDRAALAQTATPVVRGGFFTVNVGDVRRALVALPWVAEAAVRRVWPDTLQVLVQEQVAVARWGEKGLVNGKGEVFEPAPESFPEGLPQLSGPIGQSRAVLNEQRRIDGELAPLGLKVATLTLDARHAWSLRLDNGIEVVLGRSDVEARLGRFIRAYAAALAPDAERIERVDARYTNGLAVKWKQGEGEA